MTDTTPKRCGTCANWLRADGDDGDCAIHAFPVPSSAGRKCADYHALVEDFTAMFAIVREISNR